MTEGERAGWWAVALLLMVGAAAYFTIFMVVSVSSDKHFGPERPWRLECF